MKKRLKIYTILSCCFCSGFAITSCAKNVIDLTWAGGFGGWKEISFNLSSNEYLQPRPKLGYRVYDIDSGKPGQGGQAYDIAPGGFGCDKFVGHVHTINDSMTCLPFKINISGKLSKEQIQFLYENPDKSILLKDVEGSGISNRDEILQQFLFTVGDQGLVKNDEDYYYHPQNHMGQERGGWKHYAPEHAGNPTNLYVFDAGGEWIENLKDHHWDWRSQGYARSQHGSNGNFKFWAADHGGHEFVTLRNSCNANIDQTKEIWGQKFFYYQFDGDRETTNWKKPAWDGTKQYEQPELVWNFVNSEILNDSKNLNVNKWTSHDDTGVKTMICRHFSFYNWFNCIEIKMEHTLTPNKGVDWKLTFHYNKDLLAGKAPFAYYLLLYDYGCDYGSDRHNIMVYHPTENDWGLHLTRRNFCRPRGSWCGIFDEEPYAGTVVNPRSGMTWNLSGKYEINNPLAK